MSRYHLKQYEKEHMKMAMLEQEETFRQQVQELHRLYRVQQLLMADAANEPAITAMPPATARCNNLEDDDDRRAAENDAGSSRSWDDAYSQSQSQPGNNKALPPPLVVQESELELTLALGCFGATGKKAAAAADKKEASSSVDSRTASFSSSSTESGSPACRVRPRPPPSLIGSSVLPGQPTGSAGSVGHRLEQEGLPQHPWLHKCLNLAR